MRIIKEITKYHLYALISEYSPHLVDVCHRIQERYTWQEFTWDSNDKKWRFKNPEIISFLKSEFRNLEVSSEVQDEIISEQEKEEDIKELKEKKTTDLIVKGIKGNLYDYQRLGIDFLIKSQGRALLADSCGCGKTIQALGYLTHVGHKRTLIICPASVKFSWESEIKKWTNLKSFIVNPKTNLQDISSDVNCIIMNYDILKKFFNELMKYKFDCLICDEVHMCFPHDTLIKTNKGDIAIGDIVKQKLPLCVASCNSLTNEIEYKRVSNYFNSPQPTQMVKITHEYGEFTCTKNHKIFTNGKWKKAISLSSGKEVEILRQKKNKSTCVSRVVSVEILEQGGNGESTKSSKQNQYVYNLEVEGNNNYFANNVLVHNCKSASTIRTKAVKALAKNTSNVIMLTGTPVLSRPIEIFNVLNIINPRTWNNYYSFAVKYCGGGQGRWGFEAKGATNLPELKEKINKYFLRRTKEEVLKELPAKNYIEIPIDLPKEEREQYDLVESDLVEYLREFKNKKDKEIRKSLQGEKLVKLNFLREINAIGKISTAKELIDSIIEAGEKVLVFSSFNAPLLELEECYEEESVLLLGSTSVEERGEIVKQFQENPNKQIFFGGMLSAGVGITLTAASNIIFLDLPWRPADLEQAEGRAHRISAEYESLNIYKIISHDTIDGFMKKLLSHKQEIIDELIENKEKIDKNSLLNEYMDQLELKYKK